jgi:hypothetical protein
MPLAADEWLELEINDIHSPIKSANGLLHLHATGVYVRVSHRLSALEKEGQEEPLERPHPNVDQTTTEEVAYVRRADASLSILLDGTAPAWAAVRAYCEPVADPSLVISCIFL